MVCPLCLKDNTPDSRFCASCGNSMTPGHSSDATLTMAPPAREFATGSQFAGRYKIIEEIGIADNRRVQGLGAQQKLALLAQLGQ